MHSLVVVVVVALLPLLAAAKTMRVVDDHVGNLTARVGDSCSGACIDKTTTPCWGTLTPNLCPGGSNVECCTGNTPHCPGHCINTKYQTCPDGHLEGGVCPGPTGIECCIAAPTKPGPHPKPTSKPSGWTRAHCDNVTKVGISASFFVGRFLSRFLRHNQSS
jgi:hypothetical protein